ncbi:tudor domain-containing protein 3 [Uranotaenia lowii]|uniref:tudor domain-containing protein 3 n=1 Tax=Uranotaenia lowii TaxID=190385 RepID=UPI00247A03C5|nr:tudor domain-containing protein 3 [Uranotaenia lowii]
MGLLEQLQDQGWHLLPAGIEKLLEGTSGIIDVKQTVKLALDADLREIGGGALSSISSRGNKTESIDGNIVVQILKIRNVSAPKANEESKAAPRLLKLTLTDGQTQYSALEGEHVPSISLDTPPGTKILLKNGPIRITQGLLILNANNVTVLGGKVPVLLEKWELNRTMAKYAKGGRMHLSSSGPPPWIAFGQKIQQNVPQDKNFKSLQAKEKDESKENAEFTALRNDAIAEANKLGTKKTFGGGAKQMVDANVQKIMDKGFSEDQANHALKLTRNNVNRALSNLQRIEERKQVQNDIRTGRTEPPVKPGKRGPIAKRDSESESSSKPSAKVSLFDFLEDILPESDATNKKSSSKESTPFNKSLANEGYGDSNANTINRTSHSASNNNVSQYPSSSTSHYNNPSKGYQQQRFENNISSSFANRNVNPTNSGRPHHQQPQSHNTNANSSTGYKQSSDYNNSRYRGPPSNNYPNEAHPRSRQESKHNTHSSYNAHQQQPTQYRNENFNNSGPQGKYNSTSHGGGGKGQQSGYNYGHTENRTSQNYNGQADTRKNTNASNSTHFSQQQQQHNSQQGPPHNTSYATSSGKPIQGYNAGQHQNSHPSSSSNHYAPQNATGNGSGGYNNPNTGPSSKTQKNPRYSKEEAQYSSQPVNSAPPPQQGRKPPPPKSHIASQPTNVGCPQTNNNGSSPYQVANKISQLTDAAANMQIGGKQFNNATAHMMNVAKPPNPGTIAISTVPQAVTPIAAAPTASPVVPKNFIQLPNGYSYNPYQIMGFQNKQTNEFALNVLKSQQFDALQTAHMTGATVQTGSIAGVAMPPGATVVSSVLAAAPSGPTHSMAPPATSMGIPNWKVGDRCLAKYWEDGGFYNAEITGISENTFVVCFLEYGNYEEVLKTDCIPLTQPGVQAAVPPPHGHPPHPSAAMGFHPGATTHLPPGTPLLQAAPAGAYPGSNDGQPGQHFSHGYKPQGTGQYTMHLNHPAHHQSQQRPSKFREQRPMYVPPAQRK